MQGRKEVQSVEHTERKAVGGSLLWKADWKTVLEL